MCSLSAQDYFKLQPEGFRPEDVFVCESRYTTKTKSFKKIKMWTMPASSVRMVLREVPMPVVRVASMFVSAPKRDHERLNETAENGVGGFIEKVSVILTSMIIIPLFHQLLSLC